jgi:hypothetical protein
MESKNSLAEGEVLTGLCGLAAGAAPARVGMLGIAAEHGARVVVVGRAEVVVDVVAVDAVVLPVGALLVVAAEVAELVIAVGLQRRRHLARQVSLHCVASGQEREHN